MRKKGFEINGKRYVVPGVMAEIWDIKTQKVMAACKDGRIYGALRDTSKKWVIPVDALKPLEKEEIKRILVAVLWLKNDPEKEFNATQHEHVKSVFEYLEKTGFIEGVPDDINRIPYEVVLTEKGMKSATTGQSIDLNYIKVGESLLGLISNIYTIWQGVKPLANQILF